MIWSTGKKNRRPDSGRRDSCDILIFFRSLVSKNEADDEQNSDERNEPDTAAGLAACSDEVVSAVEQHGNSHAEGSVESGSGLITAVVVFFSDTVEDAHEDAEAGVTGDSGNSADEGGSEAVAEHVADIFPEGEAERGENRVYNTVVLTVELRIQPCIAFQHDIFGAFLRDSDNDEEHNDVVDEGIGSGEQRDDKAADLFLDEGDKGGEDTGFHKRKQELTAFLFQLIRPIDLDHKENSRDHGSGDENDIIYHFRCHHKIEHKEPPWGRN